MNTVGRAYLLLLLYTFFSSLPAQAAIIDVDFSNSQGPYWTGFVDTETDVLTIETWIENAGGNEQYWTPADLPLIFLAYQTPGIGEFSFSELEKYDVSEDWDGTIGQTWGFLSILKKSDIKWNEGVFTGNESRLGWGIAQNNYGTISTANYNSEEFFSFIPYSSIANRRVKAGIVPEPAEVSSPVSVSLVSLALGILLVRRKTFT